jgi:hypothetical protein
LAPDSNHLIVKNNASLPVKKSFVIPSLALITLTLLSCAEDADTSVNTEKFTTIFDISTYDAAYKPIDIVQSSDGGYIVLSSRPADDSNYSAIHLLKADQYGNFVKELPVEDSLVHPISSLTLEGGRLYFICMSTGASARLASFNETLDDFSTKTINGLSYPSAATFLPDKTFVLLGYNSEDKETLITVANLEGSLTKPVKGFSTGLGGGEVIIDKIMIEHYLRDGKHYPFSVGRVLPNGNYYFNGFVDYNFSMAFTDFSDSDEDPIKVFGESDDGGFSAVVNRGGKNFAFASFYYYDYYLFPKGFIDFDGTPEQMDRSQLNPFPELAQNATIKILPTEIDAKSIILYGSDTKSKQMGLYFYDETTGEFLGSRYLGFSNPYEFSSMTRTSDGGLAVCGTTFLAGRFPRICIFKLSEDDIKENVASE